MVRHKILTAEGLKSLQERATASKVPLRLVGVVTSRCVAKPSVSMCHREYAPLVAARAQAIPSVGFYFTVSMRGSVRASWSARPLVSRPPSRSGGCVKEMLKALSILPLSSESLLSRSLKDPLRRVFQSSSSNFGVDRSIVTDVNIIPHRSVKSLTVYLSEFA